MFFSRKNAIVDDGKQVTIISRAEWNAMPPKAIEYINHPINKCHFGVENEVGPCKTKEECLQKVKEVQNYYSDFGMEDMPYNFLIGNDGYVYEGRGWLYKPGPETTFRPEYRDHTIQIGLIHGYDVANEVTTGMLRDAWLLAKRLCNYGVQLKYVSKDYEIVGFKDDFVNFDLDFNYK